MSQMFDAPLFSSDQSIDRVLKAGLPVVMVFLGEPAAPLGIDREMKEIAKQNMGHLLLVQLQTSDSPQTARRFNVLNTPAVTTVKDGQVLSQGENITGGDLLRHVDYLLGKGPKPAVNAQSHRGTAGAYAGGSPVGNYGGAAAPGSSSSYAPGGGAPVAVTDATFDQEVMRSPLPVVVDFWAPWCGPCRMVAPALDKLAREWSGKAKIAKVNVDENPMIAGRFGVSGIPTMLVVKNGKIIDRWTGALPEPALRGRLASLVK